MNCKICLQHNPGKGLSAKMGAYPVPDAPFKELTIDFTDMGMENRVGGLRYLLVMVDRFSRWVEAFPARNEDSKTVIKWLQRELIPRFGIPHVIRSDNGTHFSNKHLQQVEQFFGIKHKFGAVYRPESQGLAERTNQTLKLKIAKICKQSNLKWPDALPIALMSIRNTPHRLTGLTPHEMLTGRRMPMSEQYLTGIKDLDVMQINVSEYMRSLTRMVKFLSSQVPQTYPTAEDPKDPEDLCIGQLIRVKVHKRKWTDPRWSGPYPVIDYTPHSVRVNQNGRKVWYHRSHCSHCSLSDVDGNDERSCPKGGK